MSVSAGARLDRLSISPFHWRTLAVIAGGLFFDGFDIYLAAGVLGSLVHSGFSDLTLNGRFIQATFFGMLLGALAAGFLGDRFGRKFSYQSNLLIFGVASIAAACAPSMTFLIIARFFIGIGLGAEVVVGYATFSEFVPPAVRGRYLGILAIPTQTALFVASTVGLFVIPLLGWRVMFVIAGIGALVIWYMRRSLPESPRWLESRGRDAEADAILKAIESESKVPLQPVAYASAPQAAAPSLWSPALLARIFVGSVALVALNAVIYGFITWLPTFFIKEGFSVVKSLGFTTIMSFGGPVGAVIGLAIADRFGRKQIIAVTAVLAAIVGSAYPFVGSGLAITAIGFTLVTLIYINVVIVFAMFVPESFPTSVRLRGTGLCNAFGRLANIISPLLVLPLYGARGLGGVVALMCGTLLVQAIVVLAFGIEPSHRSLEELTPDVGSQSTRAVAAS
jgi:putative MFS transporter